VTGAGAAGDPSSGALAPGVPLGVYVHFPFCGVHCPYCDFAVEVRDQIPHDAYADAIVAEIGARRGWFAGAGALASIYFGGGTPGLWRADALARVIDAACAAFGARDPAARAALEWFRTAVPERTLYNWQTAAARLVARDLRERS
jgi:oxygen-independent coproporphyrinogen-3 oxidase